MRMLTEETTMNKSPYVNSTLICHKMPVNGLAVIDAYLFVCVCYFSFQTWRSEGKWCTEKIK